MNKPSGDARSKPLYRTAQVVWYVVGVIEILLAFRFFLKLFAANSSAAFTAFIYGVTQPLASPFLAVFPTVQVRESIFEWSILVAMFVYWLLAWGIVKLMVMGKPLSSAEANSRLGDE